MTLPQEEEIRGTDGRCQESPFTGAWGQAVMGALGRQVAILAAQGPLGCFLLTAKAARTA